MVIVVDEQTTWEQWTQAVAITYPGAPLNLGEESYMLYFQQLRQLEALKDVQFPLYGIYADWREIARNILRQL